MMSFFMICFSEKRRKLKLIDPPPRLAMGLTEALRKAFPNQVALASWQEDDAYKIAMKAINFGGTFSFLLEHLGNI